MKRGSGETGGQKRPAYIRIAGEIREQIKDGALAPDQPVPSAAAICEQYGVSMITAKSALNLLRSEGLVYGIAGKGTFVAPSRKMVRSAPHRYFEGKERTYVQEAERAGLRPDALHQTELAAASEAVAQRLEIAAGDQVMTTRYRVFAEGRPMSISTSWEPLSITGGTPIEHPHQGEYADSGLNARFAAIGWTIEQVEEHLIVRPPTPEETETLTIPDGVHVLEVHQTVRAIQDGTDNLVPVEAADIVFPTDRYEFKYLMDRPR
ncbi:GntR family transcriptional regulator [Nonomuraea pusilla]|uniref:DNA-binding transcriptional regulator, GntR family n=1 Tax=Nonomuraea pusilla TaxID=46177 RepID=A0A1H7ZPJ5_9ACTN|nr:GntR family transcriptional regulator [Nonomuraea pusilla]SEM59784.1 DNA-binding transcriptional regulator, GntR family [Nonomuraea pusilla]